MIKTRRDRFGSGKWRTRSEESNAQHRLDCFACQEPGDEEYGNPGKGGKAMSGDVVSHLPSHKLTTAALPAQPVIAVVPYPEIERRGHRHLIGGR